MNYRLLGLLQRVEPQSGVLRLHILQKPFKQLSETLEFNSLIINTLS